MSLAPHDFNEFFREVHGVTPFPWQTRLLHQVAESGEWPSVLDLPTGVGKTAAMDIALFHLALEAEAGPARRAPVRIASVVDRRLVVDDAYTRARRLQEQIEKPAGPTAAEVGARLRVLAGDGPPLLARRLRGGIPREFDWARTPAQPTILCSTVDQIGSRLLFRGYGVTDSMKPVHAGLLGSDCLILLDEAHLSEPFRQTLFWVGVYRGSAWRETRAAGPWAAVRLSATPGSVDGDEVSPFRLTEEDRSNPTLSRRLAASKPARLVMIKKRSAGANAETDARTAALIAEVRNAIEHFRDSSHGVTNPAIAVVVNRVQRARDIFKMVSKEFEEEFECGDFLPPLLLIGPSRPADRREVEDLLQAIRTDPAPGRVRRLDAPFILVATQSIEVGVDVDLDALITEAAPLDALRQRFGRLNRAGRHIVPYSAVIAMKAELGARFEDPIYGRTIAAAWMRLEQAGGSSAIVDFGVSAFGVPMDLEAVTEKPDAPVLLPAYLDLLSHTSPIPVPDLDVPLFLHGPRRQPDAVSVVWRADLDPLMQDDARMRRLLAVVPPRSAEAIELPVWTVRRWLEDGSRQEDLADAPGPEPEREEGRASVSKGRAFRWRGDEEASGWVAPSEILPGDAVVVSARYGGVDAYGWDPESMAPVSDRGREAAAPSAGRRFAVRVAPGLLGDALDAERLAASLAQAPSSDWKTLRAELLALPLPDQVREDLESLDRARGKRRVSADLEIYGLDSEGRPRGVVFLAPFGITGGGVQYEPGSSTEDDLSGSLTGLPLALSIHREDVRDFAGRNARAAGLPDPLAADIELAGMLHDEGKRDPRFQRWLHHGDPLGPDPNDEAAVLAKSGRRLPRSARAGAGLPERWRHEALSARLALQDGVLASANDPELVVWLIGSHHGYGRPFFPHRDPTERAPDIGPQSLAFDWNGLDWPKLFERVRARYGTWELARMEAILRLADHRASELSATREDSYG